MTLFSFILLAGAVLFTVVTRQVDPLVGASVVFIAAVIVDAVTLLTKRTATRNLEVVINGSDKLPKGLRDQIERTMTATLQDKDQPPR
jgi:hypothetical protein